ncbi:SLAC1 anion channel family protein [Gynuella sunshinyii]|uniref:Tellurite resistance protein and related permease n=1 Tax=Gynuella sunshinyii YC6258 TaxID=1445510 RepID=A0A0C5V207_9GAMM|nr:SLAC1 anion channel family protein [Gynuella sunshinyii]AJQ93580.1 tellurite resistance protein and related permease [Gynuella sunshinyii YC6258]
MSTHMASTAVTSAQSRLLHFPVSMFAIAMGLAGFAVAWKAVAAMWLPELDIWRYISWLAAAVFVVVLCLYLLKWLRYPAAVREEINHPVKLNFFPTMSIAMLLFATVWMEYTLIARVLWIAALVIQLPLTLFVLSHWIYQPHYTHGHVNPSWFIPVVGNMVVPITGVSLGYHEISWFFFSVGLLFWLVLLTIVMQRLFFLEALPARLTPTLFILMAPPAVGVVAYLALNHELDNFVRILFYVTIFFALLLFINAWRFFQLPFFISSWAYSFPLAAATVACVKMAHIMPGIFIHSLVVLLFGALNIIITWLLYKTLLAIRNRAICQPE